MTTSDTAGRTLAATGTIQTTTNAHDEDIWFSDWAPGFKAGDTNMDMVDSHKLSDIAAELQAGVNMFTLKSKLNK